MPRAGVPRLRGVALVMAEDGHTHAVLLREGRTRIGRRDDADLRVDDDEASADHALIRIEEDDAWLLDTSANGTMVSGVRCMNDRVDLVDGSVLVVGNTAIVIKLLSDESIAHLAGIG